MAEQWPGDSPAAWIDDIGHAIAERYRSIEDALRATLERLIEQHLDVPDDTLVRYRAIQSLREQAARLVKQVDPEKLALWATSEAAMGASAEISRALLDFPAYAAMGIGKVTALTAGGAYAVAAVELDLRDSLRALNARILRAPADAYQAMTSKHIGSLLTGVTTSRALHRRILDQYLAEGITGFIDKSDRRWTIGAYSEMATRSAAARAWRDQSVASMAAAGVTTFTPVVGSSACSKCGAWQGKIVTDGGPTGTITVPHAITAEPTPLHIDSTLAEMRAAGWGHPNCRCTLVPGLPGGPDPTQYSTHDPQKQADREKLRELERDVRQAKRDGDPDAVGAAQAALRRHVDETGIVRRTHREQLPFADGGDTNPRGRTARAAKNPAEAAFSASSLTIENVPDQLQQLVPGVRITGMSNVTQATFDQVRGHLGPLSDLITKYPQLARIPEISFAKVTRGRMGGAGAWVTSRAGEVQALTFNLGNNFTDELMSRAREVRWFHVAEGVTGQHYVTVHELGHVADYLGGTSAREGALELIRGLVDPQRTLKSAKGILARAYKRGVISQYGASSVPELLAESFATVETSPKIATALEKAIHELIVKALRGGQTT